jgi:hypothetical protein
MCFLPHAEFSLPKFCLEFLGVWVSLFITEFFYVTGLVSFFFQSKHVIFFLSFTKSESRSADQVLLGGFGTSRRRKRWGKGKWCKYCEYMYVNGKKDTC